METKKQSYPLCIVIEGSFSKYPLNGCFFSSFGVKYFFVVSDENKTAASLQQEVRVVCWIMTYPENHAKKAVHIKATWGRRCNRLVFMSSVDGE